MIMTVVYRKTLIRKNQRSIKSFKYKKKESNTFVVLNINEHIHTHILKSNVFFYSVFEKLHSLLSNLLNSVVTYNFYQLVHTVNVSVNLSSVHLIE